MIGALQQSPFKHVTGLNSSGHYGSQQSKDLFHPFSNLLVEVEKPANSAFRPPAITELSFQETIRKTYNIVTMIIL
jgi:hypothetical protein